MTIDFNCDNCGKLLKTPEDKAGKTGKCPDCGEPVVVPYPELFSAEPENPFAVEPVSSPIPEAPQSHATKPCPMCGEQISSSARSCPACGEELSLPSDAARRFSGGHRIDVGNVISVAWNRYQQQMGVVIGAIVIAGMINFGTSMIANLAVMIDPAFVILLNLAGVAVNLWIGLGVARLTLNVARGETAQIEQVFSGGPYWGRALLAFIVIGLVAMAVGLVAVLIIAASFAGGSIAVVIASIISGLMLMSLVLMFYWVQFVLVDVDPPGISCIALSREIMSGNYLSVFVIMICTSIIAMSGAILFGIGLILTVPFAVMILAVTYDHLSGGTVRLDEDY